MEEVMKLNFTDSMTVETFFMVYGSPNLGYHSVIPRGFYLTREHADEAAKRFEKETECNGLACNYHIQEVEVERMDMTNCLKEHLDSLIVKTQTAN